MPVLASKWYKLDAQMANDVIIHNWLNAKHSFSLVLWWAHYVFTLECLPESECTTLQLSYIFVNLFDIHGGWHFGI